MFRYGSPHRQSYSDYEKPLEYEATKHIHS